MVEVVGRLESVNVGRVRRFERDGRPAASAIWKEPVAGRVRAVGVNLEGDDQADRENHGGVDQAVYAYALEDTSWWEERLGHPIEPGASARTSRPVGST
ncbi:MAG: hypothetical protein M5U14_19355 [Acidimicrobiia bacterium]|nr:hypothetical protein [Acidimicrobiia bacterium]